jgi:small-conductance mechanosensitive channel
MDSFDFLEDRYLNNSIKDYLIAAGCALLGLFIIRLFRLLVLTRLKGKAETIQNYRFDIVVNGIEKFLLPVAAFAVVFFAVKYLTLSEKAARVVEYTAAVVITFFAVRIISRTITLSIQSYIRKQENGEEKIKQMRGIVVVVNIMVWALGLVLLFDNLGYNVTAIITGLGIGGIAIALAAQNILGDLFNYFVIFFDRPFEIGDLIKIDDKTGTVEYIGVKTTRLKSVNGEQLIFSNSDLTKSRLHNYKRMQQRRVLFSLGLVFSTPSEKVKVIPEVLRRIIEAEPNVQFERAHLASIGSFSLNFEVVYHVNSEEYNDYMDVHQKINFKILKEFESLQVEFAYPTQTVVNTSKE